MDEVTADVWTSDTKTSEFVSSHAKRLFLNDTSFAEKKRIQSSLKWNI